MTRAEQAGDQGQPTWLPERQVLLEEQTVGVDYLDFSEIFDTVSYRTLWEKVAGVAWRGALLTQF